MGRLWFYEQFRQQGHLHLVGGRPTPPTPGARYVEPREAAAWLIRNEESLPEDVEQFEAEIIE